MKFTSAIEKKMSKIDGEIPSKYLIVKPNFSNREILTVVEHAFVDEKKVVLCFVPNEKLRSKLLKYVSIAIFDEFQLAQVTKVKINNLLDLKNAMLRLYGKGVETVITKMSDKGMMIFKDETFSYLNVVEEDLYKIIVLAQA